MRSGGTNIYHIAQTGIVQSRSRRGALGPSAETYSRMIPRTLRDEKNRKKVCAWLVKTPCAYLFSLF